MNLISLDAATVRTGYAVFRPSEIDETVMYLWKYGIIAPKDKNWIVRSVKISVAVQSMRLSLPDETFTIIEFPHIQPGCSVAELKRRISGMIKMACLCGMCFDGRSNLAVAQEWKGQTTKAITIARCNSYFKMKFKAKDHDITDAVMLGRWYLNQKKVQVMSSGEHAERTDLP